MVPRRYEQVIRAENAAETRRRILAAVATRLREAPTEPLSLDQVARIARTARSTIYGEFGSRAGLFEAFTADLWERTGLTALTDAVSTPDALGHLARGIRAASRMYAEDLVIYRVLFAMNRLDPESVGGAVDRMEAERLGGMKHLARRLHQDGVLRTDVTVKQATDVLWTLCSFEALDLLVTGRGLRVDRAADTLVTSARRALCHS